LPDWASQKLPCSSGVYVYFSSSGFGGIGFVRPATQYSWWDENSYLYAFLPQGGQPTRFLALPIGSVPLTGTATYAQVVRLYDPPPLGPLQIIRSPHLIGFNTNRCAWGQFSSDIVAVPGSGQPLLALFESGAEQFNLVGNDLSNHVAVGVKV
jgi:hypothetical protein